MCSLGCGLPTTGRAKMSLPPEFTESLLRIAGRSPLSRYKTGALIVYRNEVLATGWSHYGMRLSSMYSVHAELHSLLRSRHLGLSGSEIYIATVRPGTERVVMSKPCANCVHALLAAGIETAFYALESTTGKPRFRRLDLTDPSLTLKVYKRPHAARC